ncbi:MAG TPA: glycoside hydrolase family 2 TIM barrel-domain containing protein [Acidimicrobiia bacterium]|nr:glycoside hydrolase family 2 TIM barrel-domain containing protein [Acidimicrobiia bacterium]
MCEDIHAMGYSCGGLDDCWRAIRAHAGLQGGFVRDWVDQTLVQVLRDECFVWIDVRHRGVGPGACGPDTLAAHRRGTGPFRWSYRLR